MSILNKKNQKIDLNILLQNIDNCRIDMSKINLLVNDMNISPDASVEIVEQVLECLKGIQIMVITLKSHSLKDIDQSEKKYVEYFRKDNK